MLIQATFLGNGKDARLVVMDHSGMMFLYNTTGDKRLRMIPTEVIKSAEKAWRHQ